jgi:hypothetical protein
VMIPKVSNAVTISPQVITTDSRRMVRIPLGLGMPDTGAAGPVMGRAGTGTARHHPRGSRTSGRRVRRCR